jgi:hypothetical protein
MAHNAIAGRSAAQFNRAEQGNIARRIVALCVFGGVLFSRGQQQSQQLALFFEKLSLFFREYG